MSEWYEGKTFVIFPIVSIFVFTVLFNKDIIRRYLPEVGKQVSRNSFGENTVIEIRNYVSKEQGSKWLSKENFLKSNLYVEAPCCAVYTTKNFPTPADPNSAAKWVQLFFAVFIVNVHRSSFQAFFFNAINKQSFWDYDEFSIEYTKQCEAVYKLKL